LFAPGVTLHGLHPGAPEPLPGRLDAAWDSSDLGAFASLIERVTLEAELELLHFHYAVPFAELAAGVKDRLGPGAPAVVGTLHGTDVTTFGRRRGRFRLSRALRRADVLTTVSRSHAAIAADVFGFRRPLELVPNFVDTARLRPVREPGRLQPRIVHVSNFRPVKEPERMARVFVRACAEVDAELWLVGDGERMPNVRRILAEGGVAHRVRSFGLTPHVERILPRADLLVLTSRAESFGLVALEAAACGVPVLAPRVGGLPEVVLDGKTGRLFEPRDEAGAAGLVVEILGDPAAAESLGRAGVAWAARFGRDAVVDRYERLYRRVLARAPAMAREPSVDVSG
jgi:N-acetyl-alpha-D-glucosaminyl L-malate synthase BshA